MDANEHSRQIRAFVHEFNNLFLAIGGHCELLVDQLPVGQARADLMVIADATERATVLAARLRAHAIDFARATENADALSLAGVDGTRD